MPGKSAFAKLLKNKLEEKSKVSKTDVEKANLALAKSRGK